MPNRRRRRRRRSGSSRPASASCSTWCSAASPATTSPPMKPQRDAYAVIVGIGCYRDAQVRRLNYARDDAIALRDVLVDPEFGAFPEENVKLLLDADAGLRAIKGAIGKWLFQSAGPQATAIVFF